MKLDLSVRIALSKERHRIRVRQALHRMAELVETEKKRSYRHRFEPLVETAPSTVHWAAERETGGVGPHAGWDISGFLQPD